MVRTDRALGRRSAGFTLVELLATISVIFLIMGIAVVAYSAATRSARSAADRAAVNGLRLAVQQFKAEFGFVPPLVKDDGGPGQNGPLFPFRRQATDPIRYIPLVFSPGVEADAAVLRGEDPDRVRYSNYSLAYYIVGGLEGEVDGVDGPGFVEVRRDGTFAPTLAYTEIDGDEVAASGRGPKRYDSFFDLNRGGVELFIQPAASGRLPVSSRVELWDRRDVPIRYYRWSPDEVDLETAVLSDPDSYTDTDLGYGYLGEGDLQVTGLLAYLNIPSIVIDAIASPIEDRDGNGTVDAADFSDALYSVPIELRSATFAIVSAGPNRLFGDETPDDLANDDSLRRIYAERLELSEARLRSDAAYRVEALREARADNVVEVGS
ncbi:MAG: type II secretion system protein [Phycisphaerales bacterium]